MTLMRPRSPDARSLIALQRKSRYRGERQKIGGQAEWLMGKAGDSGGHAVAPSD